MQWCLNMPGRPSLELVTADQAELNEVNEAILALREAPHEQARAFSEALDDAILDGIVTPHFLSRLGAWCDAQGPRLCGCGPAQRAATVMFGQVVPRHNDLPLNDWFLGFCHNVGIPACGDAHPVTQVGRADRGSQYWLQRFVNEAPQELADLLVVHSPSLSSFNPVRVDWHSPLSAHNYYEYRDDILQPFGLAALDHQRQQFWPAGGPQWDALATVVGPADKKGCLLVEAKANLAETHSSCGARSQASIAHIRRAFATVQEFMGIQGVTLETWMQGHYQLANRLAFLYLMNEVLKIPTWLAFVNFLDDRTHIPTSLAEWRPHQVAMFRHLGLHPGCRLLDRVVTVFPRVLQLTAQ
jgi:hypothetical protein